MVAVATAERSAAANERRIAITSVFGDPLDPRTWSGAPRNLAAALERLGVPVVGVDVSPARAHKLYFAADHIARGGGAPLDGDHLRRDLGARRFGAHVVRVAGRGRRGARILHTGTLDLPVAGGDRAHHYLYCDHTWHLALRHRDEAALLGPRYRRRVEALERMSYQGLAHVFTFGDYVRDDLIAHYGVPPERVTTVGSGMGSIAPFRGPKDFARPRLLFVAKHLFAEKGGFLLLDAFRRVRAARPDAALTVVARNAPGALRREAGVVVHDFVPWERLQELYRAATLLTQPMLNDPWGQVYLEAMVSRTPVVGLARNGLPEITDGGRHGFLAATADPEGFALAILDALGDPARLAAMAAAGQRHVLERYSWDKVAARVAARIFEEPAAPSSR
jgi:glycosyltransferase involved in cell wall biosynthesis